MQSNCFSKNRRLNQCCQLAFSLSYSIREFPTAFWTCHFDDDSFVNTGQLKTYLSQFSHLTDYYIGRNSLATPSSVINKEDKRQHYFYFATGGAGLCLSRPLLMKLKSFVDPGQYISQCDQTGLSDDVLLGYLLSKEVGVRLTITNRLHSHLEDLSAMKREFLQKQITLSYNLNYENKVSLPNMWNIDDSTGFKRLTCLIYGVGVSQSCESTTHKLV